MRKHSKTIEFGSKTNADCYIAAGWELVETSAEPFALSRTIITYRVGWPDGTSKPMLLPTDDDLRDLEEGPSVN